VSELTDLAPVVVISIFSHALVGTVFLFFIPLLLAGCLGLGSDYCSREETLGLILIGILSSLTGSILSLRTVALPFSGMEASGPPAKQRRWRRQKGGVQKFDLILCQDVRTEVP